MWSEEELTTLREAFQSGDDWREAVREVSVYFPERGIRDITQQLRTLGLIASKSKSTVARLFTVVFKVATNIENLGMTWAQG